MNLNINPNFDKMTDNLWSKKKPYQIACIIMSFVLAVVIIYVLSPHMSSTLASYVVIIVVCPLGYLGFFTKNGMDLLSYLKARKSNVANGKLLYRTELKKQTVVIDNKKKSNKRRRR